MCASYNYTIPSPKRRRSNWLGSCCGIFEEDYSPVICHPEAYSVSPAPNTRHLSVYSPLPAIRQRPRGDWLSSCCGVLEEYEPTIHHPEASPASARRPEESPLSGSIWRKNIMMGGKCKMPDFSGVIIYDSAGKLVSNAKPNRLALPWK